MQTKVIIVVGVLLGICMVSVMALVTRFLVHKHIKHTSTTEDVYIADGTIERQQFSRISNSWKRLLVPKSEQIKGHWVPTLSGLIKAGDECMFSSTLFSTLRGHPGDISFNALYDAFTIEFRNRAMTERSSYPVELSKFLSTRQGRAGLRRSKSVLLRATNAGRTVTSTTSPRRRSDLSAAERGLARGMSMKRPAPAFVSIGSALQDEGSLQSTQGSWMKDGQATEYHDGQMGIKVTPSELAALSILLGSPLIVGAESEKSALDAGAFGITISSAPLDGGKQQITLRQNKRDISQQHSRGSGFSTLLAKHLAAGSLPYSQDKEYVNSILLADDTFYAIQAGASLYAKPSTTRTKQSTFLVSLPNSRETNFHILAASTEPHASATLIDAIASLPFIGGFTPLASTPLIKTVQFVASGGLPPARLLQRLDGLVEKVHRQAPHLNLFGPLHEPQHAGLLYRERERLGRLATNPTTRDTLADKSARMSRFITLLERLMALVPDTKPQDVLAAVRKATRTELQGAYTNALAASTSQSKFPSVSSRCCPESEARSKRLSAVSRALPTRRSNRSSIASVLTANSLVTPAESDTFPAQDLGKQVEGVLKAGLPLDVATVAFVARMVIVAWTVSVEGVAWEEGESGFRVPDTEELGLGDKIVFV